MDQDPENPQGSSSQPERELPRTARIILDEKSKAIALTLQTLARDFVRPIFVGTNALDANSVLGNGSFFALKLGDHLFGVTAAHVADAILQKCDQHRHLDI